MAEDRMEKDLSAMTDIEWVRGLDSAGNSIKINKTDLVELMRVNIPVATDLDNGLLNKYWTKKVISRALDMSRDEIYSFGTGGYFAALISNTINGNSAIIIFSYYNIGILGSESDFSNQDVDGKICVFKQDGTYVLKNRMYDRLTIYIDIL